MAEQPTPPPTPLLHRGESFRFAAARLTGGGHHAATPYTGFEEGFLERTQELTLVASQLSFSGAIAPEDRVKFSLELRNYHLSSAADVASHLGSHVDRGLDARAAASLLATHGPNVLTPPHVTPMWARFLWSFASGFSPLLWAATFFVFLSYRPFGAPPGDVYNLMLAIVLLVVIAISACFQFWQELVSSRVLASVKELIPSATIVIRDGRPAPIAVADLTLGDVVALEAGCRIPADMRVLHSDGVRVDKSMLTGESDPVRLTSGAVRGGSGSGRHSAAQQHYTMLDAPNMAFAGTIVTEGSGRGVVIAVGDDNAIGKIVSAVGQAAAVTPLQLEINRFVGLIAVFACVTCVAVVSVWAAYLRPHHPTFMNTSLMITNAISVIVAFVPCGLSLALSAGMTIIARRLFSHGVLVKGLSTVETLGSVSLIATDKTGTLTTGRMSVVALIAAPGGSGGSSGRGGVGGRNDEVSAAEPTTNGIIITSGGGDSYIHPSSTWLALAAASSPSFTSALRAATLCSASSLRGAH